MHKKASESLNKRFNWLRHKKFLNVTEHKEMKRLLDLAREVSLTTIMLRPGWFICWLVWPMRGNISQKKSLKLAPWLDLSFAGSQGEYICMWRCPRPGFNPSGLVNNSSLAAGPQFTEVKIL